MGCPVQIAAGAPLCVTARSARAKTFDVVATVLLPATESPVEEVTLALLTIAPAFGRGGHGDRHGRRGRDPERRRACS